MKISVSFLGIKENFLKNIEYLTSLSFDMLHVDIMDGIFVSNKTPDITDFKESIKNKPLDIHLMVEDVYSYINKYKDMNVSYITIHYEVKENVLKVIEYLKSLNIKVGLSIKPATKVSEILDIIPLLDLVLVMSVEPGLGGQEFIEETVNKIRELKKLKEKYNYLIEVDGGINNETIKLIKEADIAVIGSYITNGNYEERLNKIKESIYE